MGLSDARATKSTRFGGYTALGRFMRKRRLELDLTQEELGRRIRPEAPVDSSYVSQLENGKDVNSELPTLERYARALEVSLYELIAQAGLLTIDNPANETAISPQFLALKGAAAALDEDDLEDILAVVRAKVQRQKQRYGTSGTPPPPAG